MAAKKRAAAKSSAGASTKRKAAKKKIKTAPRKTSAKKKAARKKAPAKKKAAARKKAAAKKKATPRKRTARKKATSRANEEVDEAAAASAAPVEAPPPPAEAEAAPAEREAASTTAATSTPASSGLARGIRRGVDRGRRRRLASREGRENDDPKPARSRRRTPVEPAVRGRRPIPPLPDEDEEFVPYDDPPKAPATEARPANDDPRQLLELVRSGEKHISALNDLTDNEVRELARGAGLKPRRGERRSETIYRLIHETAGAVEQEPVIAEGLLELHPDGYGFLRQPSRNYSQHPEDVYVSAGKVRQLGLKAGHWVSGRAHRPRPHQPYLALKEVEEVNHEPPERLDSIVPFEKLTVVYPDTRFVLETTADEIEMRVMDLFCPLGRGQRGLIVAPPRTGKTIMLQKLADAIATNSPDVDIVVLLVDERPEEVTNMRRSVRGEVVASTFDKPASNHIRVAELVMEKVKRMVEYGRHVVLLLDSITRMGRAYNNQTGGSGRILTGGLDAKALTKPKRFFGTARNVEDGGSLTIVATALIDTGSKMDEVIFEEFKGSGNMELVLSRDMANARVWPAIDVPSSATRNEDLLMHPDELRRVTLLRRGITGQDPQAVMLALRDQLQKNTSNAQFLMTLGN